MLTKSTNKGPKSVVKSCPQMASSKCQNLLWELEVGHEAVLLRPSTLKFDLAYAELCDIISPSTPPLPLPLALLLHLLVLAAEADVS